MNNAEFIDGLRNKDHVAAQHLQECYVPTIWRYVYFRVDRDSHLAEDIVAEVVLALVNAATGGMQIEHPAAWLRTVAQRRIQDHFRAAARVQHLVEQVEQHPQLIDENDPAKQHDQQLKRQSVRDAMDDLPENYRMALEWKYVEQLSVKTIADRLGASEKSAESLLFRARNALRKQLDRRPPGGRPYEADHEAERSRDAPQPNVEDTKGPSLQNRTSAFYAPRLAGEN